MTRSALVRVAACAALGIALGACGHYGQPVRTKPQPEAGQGPEGEAHPTDHKEKLPNHVE